MNPWDDASFAVTKPLDPLIVNPWDYDYAAPGGGAAYGFPDPWADRAATKADATPRSEVVEPWRERD